MGRRRQGTQPQPGAAPSPSPAPRRNGFENNREIQRGNIVKKIEESKQEILLEYALYQDGIRQVLGINQALGLESWAEQKLKEELGIRDDAD